MPDLGILTIHGMGRQRPDYASELENRLRDRLTTQAQHRIVFQPIWFHGEFQGQQEDVWSAMQGEALDWRWLRRFFLYYFSDATVTERQAGAPDSVYRRIQIVIKRAVDALRLDLGEEDKPVVVLAHSLGCQVISNYIWDAQRGLGIWENQVPQPFQALSTTRLMITSGCNIPLFVSGLEKIAAIDRPNDDFEWVNFYDRDDVLGWPLRPLSSGFDNSYREVVTSDREINTGVTPLAHSDYWTDRDFLAPVAAMIEELVT